MKKAWLSLLSFAFVGCSAGTNEHPSPPISSTYELQFPSTAVAVAVQSVQVFVFDGSVSGNDCTSLLILRKSGGALPQQLVATDVATLCDVQSGAKGQLPELAFGQRSFLAVTQRSGQDFFIGCGTASLSATSGPVEITLGPASSRVTVPPTTCTVQAHCAGTCM